MSGVFLCDRSEEKLVDLTDNMAQVVMGVRRSGKSTLCYQVLKKETGHFAYVNFDDERLADVGADDLNTVLEILYKIYGDFDYLFLDEIQNITSWYLFVNRLLRKKIHILVTGSNAKLLSGELATHLTGRYEQIELFPFSFAEFCQYHGIDKSSPTTQAEAQRRAAFDQYLKQGGFPELLSKKNKARYINTLVNDILQRDIQQRHVIKYASAFEQMAHHLLNTSPVIVSEKNLTESFGLKSPHTVKNYIHFLKQAYLLSGVKKYTPKSRQRVRDEKLYPIDVSLMDGRADAFVGANLGWRLETTVYIELLRRNHPISKDVYYYRNADGYEADFVVCRGNHVEEIYQVCYNISNPQTLQREVRGLLAASKETKCDTLFLITDFHREDLQARGKTIQIRPAYEWLLTKV